MLLPPEKSTPLRIIKNMRYDLLVTAAMCLISWMPIPISATDCGLYALGDIHGDLMGAISALRSAGLVNRFGNWTGGCAVLVQTGDITDRGGSVRETYDYFFHLRAEAAQAEGRVVMLLGNHELLNFEGVTTYVNPEELRSAGGAARWKALFGPKGKYRTHLEKFPVATIINSIVFVHAGILPQFAALGIDGINKIAHDSIAAGRWNEGILGDTGPFWTREIITQAMREECGPLSLSLSLLGGERMVVGHSIQMDKLIHTYCNGALVAIDIGFSRAIFGEHPGLVQLTADNVRKFYGESVKT